MNRLAIVLLRVLFLVNAWGVIFTGIVQTIHPANAATLTLLSLKHSSIFTASQENHEMLNPQQIIAAEVLLRPATGATINGNTIITSENIANYIPAPETVQTVSQFFRDNGFKVTPVVGVSFTISGTLQSFSQFFNTSLIGDQASGFRSVSDSTASEELPLDALPNAVKNTIVAVTFVPPPDFGPTRFGP